MTPNHVFLSDMVSRTVKSNESIVEENLNNNLMNNASNILLKNEEFLMKSNNMNTFDNQDGMCIFTVVSTFTLNY